MSALSRKPLLIIPDIHQDIAWVQRILHTEQDSFDEVVFLGDYWDSFNEPPAVSTATDMAAYLSNLHEDLNATFLLGNHDLPYLEAWPYLDKGIRPEYLRYDCPGFTVEKAQEIHATLPFDFWKDTKLFLNKHGHLISHAGLHPRFWMRGRPVIENLDALARSAKDALDELRTEAFSNLAATTMLPIHPLLAYSPSRGFDTAAPSGGITWLDWDDEFKDSLPVPQIVGHSTDTRGARQKGRSWCLDGYQTCYGLLYPNGTLEVKYPA